ncbi:MAG: hypothetical protein DRG55_01840 [Deltaproteobacteria bacterium]|nr:MAG: hypothetical protein DRG55_01840 [Deltaproteobacteria bacterium]
MRVLNPLPDHKSAFRLIRDRLPHGEIAAVGHRVVHGGESFSGSVMIDDAVLKAIEENVPLAPLHNPANLQGIKVAMELFPDVPHVAVFDTAFHQDMAPEVFLYPLPYDLHRRYGIKEVQLSRDLPHLCRL